MTAVVGILNKTAVALAADSAVTVSGENGRKIFNTANKIFKLSKFHPVGIAIYNAASFVRTPWEIVIKTYREQLKETSFPTIEDYKNDFINYLHTNKKYVSQSAQQDTIKQILGGMINYFDDKYRTNGGTPPDDSKDTVLAHVLTKLKEFVQEFIDEHNSSPRNEGISKMDAGTLNDFVDAVGTDEIFDDFEITDAELKALFISAVKSYIHSSSYHFDWSGLVFCGYGDDEIFSSLRSIHIAEVVADVVRWNPSSECTITDTQQGAILPFAQTDVIKTIIEGVSPKMDAFYRDAVKDFLHQYNQVISGLLSGDGEEWEDVRSKITQIDIDQIADTLYSKIEEAKAAQSINPTVQTVSILSKEDLGEMAESLIYMTYLKRRIMSDEESVGGPVDVAIISKTDGFIWIKRKYYFREDLNPHFLHNYYKNM